MPKTLHIHIHDHRKAKDSLSPEDQKMKVEWSDAEPSRTNDEKYSKIVKQKGNWVIKGGDDGEAPYAVFWKTKQFQFYEGIRSVSLAERRMDDVIYLYGQNVTYNEKGIPNLT